MIILNFKGLTLMKILIFTFTLLLMSVANAGDAERGSKLYNKCMSCHGKDGMGKKSQNAPMIAGQYDWYIVTQIKNIISGKRENKNTKKMYPFVKNLNEQDIQDLAAYIASLDIKK